MSTLPTKRSRPGRSSRRRKRKAQSILDAAAFLVDADAKSSTPEVPADRDITLEGVKARRREFRRRGMQQLGSIADGEMGCDNLEPSDEEQLTSQLGFVPGNAVCVAARLAAEFYKTSSANGDQTKQLNAPSVVKLYPMVVRDCYHGGKTDGRKFKGRRRGGMRAEDDKPEGNATDVNDKPKQGEANHADINEAACKQSSKERFWFIESDDANKRQIIEPFPTLYWLTSPILRSHISQIELSKTHGVQKMEQRLKSSNDHIEQMSRAHKSYGQARWELLTDTDREEVLKRGWNEALGVRRGVAGIRPKRIKGGDSTKEVWDGVKCLHAHAAHYLAQIEEWRVENEVKNDACGLAGLIEKCDRDDINLIGKWTMEAVLEIIQ